MTPLLLGLSITALIALRAVFLFLDRKDPS